MSLVTKSRRYNKEQYLSIFGRSVVFACYKSNAIIISAERERETIHGYPSSLNQTKPRVDHHKNGHTTMSFPFIRPSRHVQYVARH